MDKNSLQGVMSETVANIIDLVNANSVCSAPFEKDGFTFIPINKMSVNYAAGGGDIPAGKRKAIPKGCGANVKLTPISFLVVKDGKVKTVSIKSENQNAAAFAELLINTAKEIFEKKKQIG